MTHLRNVIPCAVTIMLTLLWAGIHNVHANRLISTPDGKREKPNIIFILADDLGWGELGCYGNSFNETPNLDKLALQGIRFTQAYAAAPVCSPTRASIMTGQYPARVGITDFLAPASGRLLDPARYITINEALGQAGYRTGLVGKWHLDTDFKNNKGGPGKHGFDEVIGTETKYIADGDYFFPYDKISTFSNGVAGEYLTDRQSEEAAGFIQRNKRSPFYLFLSYYSVHTRLDAPEALVNKYKRKFDAKYGEGQAEKLFEGKAGHQSDHHDNPYLAAMLERMDAGVGKIMDALERNGLADNTLLVFFSDNGGANHVANNGGLRMNKTWLYEGGIRVPLIMRLPGTIKAASVTDAPVSSQDFYPTFVDIARAAMPRGYRVDGTSLYPLVTKGKVPEREAMFWHYPAETGKWKNRMSSAIRKGDYKLIYFYVSKRAELFNLKADPEEKQNLADQMPAQVSELMEALNKWKAEVKAEQAGI
ncbi:sulfatase [Dawidia soli]|uniref:Sulfatase n=1 Tax=Dawidia soli TaxID=2782352 RepID=A0AAP2DFR4_9BACT|nr:sulfatase [Dawidia soli]MBT1688512.1 sulfatase [Dawidia soli]